jgi:hypothetical protein
VQKHVPPGGAGKKLARLGPLCQNIHLLEQSEYFQTSN